MKCLTFAVPCYNSQDYLDRCVSTLLAGGEDVEIILVNDGSSDDTARIIDEYELAYPSMIRAIHQLNKGHGGAVNTGLAHAKGTYFKVVDSDDWVDTKALGELIACCKQETASGRPTDLIIGNYVYDHLHEGKQRPVHYRNVFPRNKVFGWNDIKSFAPSQYMVMHSLMFNTKTLRESGIELPQHMFYVDNIFACKPLGSVNTMRYLDINLYHYFIGREDQSVNENVMCERIDQQIAVTKLVAECIDEESSNEKLKSYLIRNTSIMMAISSIHLLLIGTEEAKQKRDDLWHYIEGLNPTLYKKLRYQTLSGFTYLPGKAGDLATVAGYKAAKKIYKFQ